MQEKPSSVISGPYIFCLLSSFVYDTFTSSNATETGEMVDVAFLRVSHTKAIQMPEAGR
jgi:hypothetical protein